MCPFGFKRKWTKFSFGVDPEFMDYVTEREDEAEREYNERNPRCWDKFLAWLGIKK